MLGGPENSEVRVAAAEALGKLGEHAVPTLTECLKDEGKDVRRVAAEAVVRSREGGAEQGLGGRATEPGCEGCAPARDRTVPRIRIFLTRFVANQKIRRCA